jgi:uncharacterized protein YqjF (DUF2071 family)
MACFALHDDGRKRHPLLQTVQADGARACMTRRDLASAGVFLTACWRHLLMLNYVVDPAVLEPFAPRGTEVDTWNGRTFASMVGFRFLDTRVAGIGIPWHRDFEEINLRFYVRRKVPDGWRRGVVFLREIVPRPAIALVARFAYNERHVARPMSHRVDTTRGALFAGGRVEYAWRERGHEHRLGATLAGSSAPATPGSEEEFITEHYWGYSAQRDGGCVEYQVEHPPWNVWPARDSSFACDVSAVYGPAFHDCLTAPPASAFVAEGSAIVVRRGVRL